MFTLSAPDTYKVVGVGMIVGSIYVDFIAASILDPPRRMSHSFNLDPVRIAISRT